MDYLPQFKHWLESRSYSPSTIRNYLADISRYQEYTNKQLTQSEANKFSARSERSPAGEPEGLMVQRQQDSEHCKILFASDNLKSYILSIHPDPNYRRYLSSLNKFCQFALDQQLINSNPIKQILRQLQSPPKTNHDDLLKQYQTYLVKKKKSPITIKNYINDLQQYLKFHSSPS